MRAGSVERCQRKRRIEREREREREREKGKRIDGGLRRRRRGVKDSGEEGEFGSARERNRVVRSEGMRVLGRDGGEEG